ncbi:MAG: diacylglycerol kinase family lipid kinase [Anaerolineae bacterium]
MEAVLIYNPTAGPRHVRGELERLRPFFRRRGWSVELRVTKGPGDATRMAREAAMSGQDAVIVAGGDGTVNEVVNGLVGTGTAMGVLPVGTGNLWAKELRVPTYALANPMRLREAAAGLVGGTVRAIDVGRVGKRNFLCWASAGLDAKVTDEMEPRERSTKRLGALPYVVAAVLVARDFKGVEAEVVLDGEVVSGRILLVVANNIQRYGGLLEVAPQARLDDGLLDIFVFKGLGMKYVVRHLVRVLSRRVLDDPEIVHRQGRRIEVRTEEPVSVQADGDPVGSTPVGMEVVPGALRIIAPPTMPSDLLGATIEADRQ